MKKNFYDYTRCSGESGFTLLEMMIAMVIGLILSGGMYIAYTMQQRMYTTQDLVAEMQQNQRAALLVVGREIRMAGYDPNGDLRPSEKIMTATATEFSFKMVADDDGLDNNGVHGTDEPGESKQVTYDLYDAYNDGVNDMGRLIGTSASTKRAIAENIENVEFYYTDKDGNASTAPTAPADIRSVQISILARSKWPVRKFTDSATYTSGSGVVWGPFNDHFKRKLLVTTINCRNLGLGK